MVYTLKNLIGSKICKFNKFVNNLNVKAFLDDNSTLSCECAGCSFVDKDYNQVTTDNLKIITNNKWRKPFSKGPKYQENRTTDYGKDKESIITGIESCIQS